MGRVMMNAVLATAFISVALSGLQQTAIAQSEEVDALSTAYIRCVAEAARSLDDRISDAQTIAIGADVVCEDAKRRWVRTFLPTMNINPDSSVGRDILEQQLGNHSTATGIVLKVRANARKAAK